MKTLKISEVFTNAPGGRLRKDGPFSGEEFREDVLIPVFDQLNNEQLLIDLDGGFGYATCFLHEVFNGMAIQYGIGLVLSSIVIKTDEEPSLKDEIFNYITETNLPPSLKEKYGRSSRIRS
jgi:hypothetical protein